MVVFIQIFWITKIPIFCMNLRYFSPFRAASLDGKIEVKQLSLEEKISSKICQKQISYHPLKLCCSDMAKQLNYVLETNKMKDRESSQSWKSCCLKERLYIWSVHPEPGGKRGPQCVQCVQGMAKLALSGTLLHSHFKILKKINVQRWWKVHKISFGAFCT